MSEHGDVPAGTEIPPAEDFIPLSLRAKMISRKSDEVRDLPASKVMELLMLNSMDPQKVADEFMRDRARWPSDSDEEIMRRIYGDAMTPTHAPAPPKSGGGT